MSCEGVLIRHCDVGTRDATSHDAHKPEQPTTVNDRQTRASEHVKGKVTAQ